MKLSHITTERLSLFSTRARTCISPRTAHVDLKPANNTICQTSWNITNKKTWTYKRYEKLNIELFGSLIIQNTICMKSWCIFVQISYAFHKDGFFYIYIYIFVFSVTFKDSDINPNPYIKMMTGFRDRKFLYSGISEAKHMNTALKKDRIMWIAHGLNVKC